MSWTGSRGVESIYQCFITGKGWATISLTLQENNPSSCISDISPYCTKIPGKSNIIKGLLRLAALEYCLAWGKRQDGWSKIEASGHVESKVRKQRKVNASVHLVCLVVSSPRSPHHGTALPTFRLGLSPSGD